MEDSSDNLSKKVEKRASFSEFLDSKLNKSVLFKPNNIEVLLFLDFFGNGYTESKQSSITVFGLHRGHCLNFEVEIDRKAGAKGDFFSSFVK